MRVISGKAGGLRLKTIKGNSTRPTADIVKEGAYNIIAAKVPGSVVLDLFAGSGGLGIEALSRGADSCTFVDNNAACCFVISENLNKAHFNQKTEILKSGVDQAIVQLSRKGFKFDIILLDPPYYKNIVTSTLNSICNNDIINNDGIVIAERHKKDVVPDSVANLVMLKERRYGDTVISIYCLKGCLD